MFHIKDGWFFERMPLGGVAIIKRESANPESSIVHHMIASPKEWASIIASVSANGETSENWERAREFHRGLTPHAADKG